MILNKKGLAVLPLVALLFSCGAKAISYKDALNFIKDNYKATEPKTSNSGHLKIEGKADDEASKKDLIAHIKEEFGIELKDDLKANQDYEEEISMQPLNTEMAEKQLTDDFEYSLKGKELTIKYTAGQMWGPKYVAGTIAATCNSEGYPYMLDLDVEYNIAEVTWSYCAINTLNY